MPEWSIPTAWRYDLGDLVQLDLSWLPEWHPTERQGRPTITQIGHAHTSPVLRWVEHPVGLGVYKAVPVPGEHTWCTRGWDFWTLHVTYERRVDGEPVLCGWPFEALRAIEAGPTN